jgi:DNA gyrase subunit A
MNILPLMPDEKITAALAVHSFDKAEYLTMITRKGRIKRCAVSQFSNVRPSGLIALNLDDDDRLGWVKLTAGGQDLILVSEQGKGIRFSEEDVRPMGRAAAGVNAMKLDDWDNIAGADIVGEGEDVLVITEKGYGKRTPTDEYRQQNRYGQGVLAMRLSPERTGHIVSARVVASGDEVTCISMRGIMLRTAVDTISQQSRVTQGVRVMELRQDDSVASVAVIREGRLSQVGLEADAATENGAKNGQPPQVLPQDGSVPS